jgi:N-methylhydantoinase B
MTTTFDAISLKILWNRLIAVADEAAATLVRTSFSTVVRESNDFACVLLDREGRSLAQNSAAIPSFIGTLPITVKHVLKKYPSSSLSPGDVIITNDPWLATGHLPDITVVMPIFRDGELIAFAGSVAHLPDIGGRIRSPDAKQVYEEGLRIPIVKLYEGGYQSELLIEIIRNNVRVPDQVIGDLMAQVAANELAARRLIHIMDELDLRNLTTLAQEIHNQSEQAMRSAIRAIPDGTYASEVRPDGYDEELRIAMQLTVSDDEVHVDYTGTSSQIGYALNTVLNYTFAYTAYPIKCITSPDIPNNEGSFNPITVSAPEGCLLNPTFPAAVGGRALIGHFLSAAVFTALAPVLPSAVQAPSGSPLWCLTMTGQSKGKDFAGVYFFNGGQGASERQDGISCLSFPSNVSNTPVEVMEALTPLLIKRKMLQQNSGGAGRRRGGLGQQIQVHLLGDSPVTVAFLADRLRNPADGLLGGQAGARGCVKLNDEFINPKLRYQMQPGDLVTLETPGGGGFGPVMKRDAKLISNDLANGLITSAKWHT